MLSKYEAIISTNVIFFDFFGTENFQLYPLSRSKHKHLFLTKKLAVVTVSCIHPHSRCSQQDHHELHEPNLIPIYNHTVMVYQQNLI